MGLPEGALDHDADWCKVGSVAQHQSSGAHFMSWLSSAEASMNMAEAQPVSSPELQRQSEIPALQRQGVPSTEPGAHLRRGRPLGATHQKARLERLLRGDAEPVQENWAQVPMSAKERGRSGALKRWSQKASQTTTQQQDQASASQSAPRFELVLYNQDPDVTNVGHLGGNPQITQQMQVYGPALLRIGRSIELKLLKT